MSLKHLSCVALFWGIVPLYSQEATPAAVQATNTAAKAYRPRTVRPENVYIHVIAVVPMIGSGTLADPRRPLYAPVSRPDASSRTGILAFTHVPSDDGNFAIVEFVCADRKALQQVIPDKSLVLFEKGKDQKSDIEAALQKVRKNFTLDPFKFGAIAQ